MDERQMLQELYRDYNHICVEWEEHLTELREKLSALDEAKQRLSQLETDLQVHRHTIITAEMHDEGRINGSNAAKRKRQTEILLADLPDLDPDYNAMLTAAEKLQIKVDDLDLDIQMLRAQISALRNQARMVGGLACALGG
jgi:predicted  nucleic acid-binding Zn-ribbon protein